MHAYCLEMIVLNDREKRKEIKLLVYLKNKKKIASMPFHNLCVVKLCIQFYKNII